MIFNHPRFLYNLIIEVLLIPLLLIAILLYLYVSIASNAIKAFISFFKTFFQLLKKDTIKLFKIIKEAGEKYEHSK